jgi:hypothetical protein
MFVKTCQGKAS